MEDDRSDETAWVKAQNEVTYGYLNQIFSDGSKTRLENCGITKKIGVPLKKGILPIFSKITDCKSVGHV
jgi:prolyl oligopeptidase